MSSAKDGQEPGRTQENQICVPKAPKLRPIANPQHVVPRIRLDSPVPNVDAAVRNGSFSALALNRSLRSCHDR